MPEKRQPAAKDATVVAEKVEQAVTDVVDVAPAPKKVQEPARKTVKKAKQAVEAAVQPEPPVTKVEEIVDKSTPTNGDLANEVKAAVPEVKPDVEKPPVTKQVLDMAKNVAEEIEKNPVAHKVLEQVKMTADQIDNSKVAADVRKAAHDARSSIEKSPLTAAVHKVLLASIGAVALAQEEMEDLVNRLVERGEIAEADGKRMLKDVFEQRKKAMDKAQAMASEMAEAPKRMADDVEKRVESVLSRMNIPSKDEIEALSAKITALTRKVDELKKS